MKMINSYDGSKDQALFAGGCFWCVEAAFEKTDGVIAAISGFAGGEEENPSYDDVAYGKTSHREAVLVIFDPEKISYKNIVQVFWENIDPTDTGGQYADRGHHYTTAIYTASDEQEGIATASKAELETSLNATAATEILPATNFYPAEEYHQNYYKKNPIRYELYRQGSGRG